MNKRVVIVLALAVMLVPTVVFAGGDSEGGQEYEQVVYAYATFNNIPDGAPLSDVEDAINAITRDRIGVEVDLMPIAIWDYGSQVSLELQSGEKIDVFESLGDFPNSVATGMAYDITDIAPENAAESMDLFSEEWLAACTVDGRLYGFPTYKPIALTPMVVYRRDIAEELGLDMSRVNSPYDLLGIFRAVEAAYPEMTPMAAVSGGDLGLVRTIPQMDYLGDSFVNPMGVLLGPELEVVNLYDTEEFANIVGLARTFYNEGLVMRDAATTSSTAAELMASGNYFCYVASYSYPEADTAASLEPQCGGYPLGAKMIGDAYLSTADINMLTWMVSANSDVPEAALRFLNLTMTDQQIVNLLIYGIEGRDYVLTDQGTARYPDGNDASTVPYTAQLSCGTLGNFFNMYPMLGTDPASLVWELDQNINAATSPAMGFTFDSSGTRTEYTAVVNVIQQYLPGLSCGSLDPATGIPEFLDRLDQAGLPTIIQAKQTQLDAWARQVGL